jgi:Malectin domain
MGRRSVHHTGSERRVRSRAASIGNLVSTFSFPSDPTGACSSVFLIVAASIVHCSFTTCGQRLFNAVVEQNVVYDIDICQLGGGEVNKAVNKISSAAVYDGLLTIELQSIIENPTIAAIEVNRVGETTPVNAPVSSPPTPFSTILINCGGSSYTDTRGRSWASDRYFKGGASYYNSANEISGTADDVIYLGERWGTFSYSIPLPKGDYDLILHFAEI